MIIKTLGAALVLGFLAMGFLAMGIGTANADPNPPDPTRTFGTLTIDGAPSGPHGDGDGPGELERGLLDGLAGHRLTTSARG